MGKAPLAPKEGARFHFELPGAVQGFQPEDSVESKGTVRVVNVPGHSKKGSRSLAIQYHHVAPGRVARVATATFTPPEALNMAGYKMLASPTLHPGQTVRARVVADEGNGMPITCRIYVRKYGAGDRLARVPGPAVTLQAGAEHEFVWPIGDMSGSPIAEIGVEVSSDHRADGTVYLGYLTWEGAPDVVLTRPAMGGTMWRRAWVDGVDDWSAWWPEPYRLVQNYGTGLLMQGTRDWMDYRVSADVRPHIVTSVGIGARVQGMRRYYALLLCKGAKARLVKVVHDTTVLAERDFDWEFGQVHDLSLEVVGNRIRAWIDGDRVFEVYDDDRPLMGGAVALICEEGRTATETLTVRPASE